MWIIFRDRVGACGSFVEGDKTNREGVGVSYGQVWDFSQHKPCQSVNFTLDSGCKRKSQPGSSPDTPLVIVLWDKTNTLNACHYNSFSEWLEISANVFMAQETQYNDFLWSRSIEATTDIWLHHKSLQSALTIAINQGKFFLQSSPFYFIVLLASQSFIRGTNWKSH